MELFLSPHLDDAVSSCGGAIARAVREGDDAVLLTVFAGDTRGRKLPPRAARYHAKCGLTDFWTRRWEDIEACELLGVGMVQLDFAEILYRYDEHGRPRCTTRDDLFSPLGPDDHALAAEVASVLEQWVRRLCPTQVYGPLGLGAHVDHVITNVALRRVMGRLNAAAPGLLLYEEMPYAAIAEASPASATVPLRRLSKMATPVIKQLTEHDWASKLRAIGAYRSQLASIWHGANWQAELRRYAAQLLPDGGPAERFWQTHPTPAEAGALRSGSNPE